MYDIKPICGGAKQWKSMYANHLPKPKVDVSAAIPYRRFQGVFGVGGQGAGCQIGGNHTKGFISAPTLEACFPSR